MGNQGTVAVWLVLLAASGATVAAEPAPSKAPAPERNAAVHDEIRAMRDGILQAIKTKDADALIAFFHPDVVLTVQDGKELKGIRKHEGLKEYVVRLLTGPQPGVKSYQPTLTVDEPTILYGDEMGIAFGSSRDHYVLADNRELDVPTRWSATLVKHQGKWKVADLQVASNPFDNPVVESATKMLYWVGGGAAAIGFLLGLLVMKLFSKSPRPTAPATV